MAKKKAARKRSTRAKKAVKKAVKKTAKKTAGRTRKSSTKAGAKKGAGRKPAKSAARKSAAKGRRASKPAAADQGLLTLTEVSKRTGISMPTLQRYKKLYQERLPTVGEGRTQRYKPESLAIFERIKKENLKKRGRPRKSAAAPSKPSAPARSAAKAPKSAAGLISLSEIGRRTGISYPTLLRYVRLHDDRIPSHGSGRKRRFPVAAVPVFKQLRKESRRGRRKGSGGKKAPTAGRGLEGRLRQLEKSHAGLEKKLQRLLKVLQKPLVKGG